MVMLDRRLLSAGCMFVNINGVLAKHRVFQTQQSRLDHVGCDSVGRLQCLASAAATLVGGASAVAATVCWLPALVTLVMSSSLSKLFAACPILLSNMLVNRLTLTTIVNTLLSLVQPGADLPTASAVGGVSGPRTTGPQHHRVHRSPSNSC